MTSREKVIEHLQETAEFFRECRSDVSFASKAEIRFWELQNAANEAAELLKEQGWNKITEDADGAIHGLPGDDGQYLMTDGKDIWIDDYVDGVADGVILDSGRDIREITAWMYMPELPKKDRR